jgi:4-hydroxymandelate oxidase
MSQRSPEAPVSPSSFDPKRRTFITTSATFGAGLLAANTLGTGTAQAQQPAPAAGAAAAPAAAKPLKMAEVFAKAREVMYPVCRVCPECDGVACAGEVPGLGGFGSGASFRNNFTALKKVQLKLRSVHEVKKPDMAITLFGQKLALPALAAPTGGTTYNMGGKMTEDAFAEAILSGCAQAGTLGAIADGIGDPIEVFEKRLTVLTRLGAKAIVGLKPRTQEEIIARIRKAEEAGVVAITIDIDSSGRAARALPGQTVEPKSVKQIRELVAATKLPILIKGIMTVDEAQAVADAGAAGIVVSNHGGRVLDHTPGTAEVLPAIAGLVKGKMVILVDGTVRYGHDVLKYVALGADAVLMGRHLIRGAHGGGAEGVALFVRTMRGELEAAMTLTGMASVKAINRTILV